MQAFLTDASPKAYENQVERLLRSPHFGERMAVWWLDVARFTDTVGFHGDQNQRIFPYRDYVIDSFNTNKPFDQFTLEQIAGDLLETRNQEQRTTNLVATGFNRLNMVTREGGAQPKEYLAKYGAERVRTVGGAWLGATLGCSECHDHKFDPFTARDFYAMQAFFADVKQWGYYADARYAPNPELKGFGNEHPFPPEIEVESGYLKERAARIRSGMKNIADAALRGDVGASPKFAAWKQAGREFFKLHPDGWSAPRPDVTLAASKPVAAKGKSKTEAGTVKDGAVAQEKAKAVKKPASGEAFKVNEDGRVRFVGKAADTTSITLRPPAGWVSALRLELLPDTSHEGGILRGGAQTAATLKLSASMLKADSGKPLALAFRHADADLKEPRYSGGAEIIGIKDAWKTSAASWNRPHTAMCVLDKPVMIEKGDEITLRISGNSAGCVRLSISPFAPGQRAGCRESGRTQGGFGESRRRESGCASGKLSRQHRLERGGVQGIRRAP